MKDVDIEAIDWFIQQELIRLCLPDLAVGFTLKDNLGCFNFTVQLPNSDYKFNFRVYYKPIFLRTVQLIQPLLFCENKDIVRHLDNHINEQGQICYFYPGDLSHKAGISCLYAIQSAIKWADCYNYWSKNQIGGWPAAEMPHGSYSPAFFNISRPLLIL